MKRLPKMVRRQRATQLTQDRFIGKPLDWSKGRHCVKMAHSHARAMGARVPKLPAIRSPLAARRAMKVNGWDSVSAMLDSLFVRIPPAFMLIGDLAVVPGDEGMESVVVCTGTRMMLGWLPDGSAVANHIVDPNDLTGAWRVEAA